VPIINQAPLSRAYASPEINRNPLILNTWYMWRFKNRKLTLRSWHQGLTKTFPITCRSRREQKASEIRSKGKV